MRASPLALVLVGLAAAVPAVERSTVPRYPATSLSKGFRLVVNLTDACRDFCPPIQSTYIAAIHTGAGLGLVGSVRDPAAARIFYQNATAEQRRSDGGSVITDGGTPPFPSGLKLVQDDGSDALRTAHLDAGRGTPGIGIARFPEPYAFLTRGTWVACIESLPYYRGRPFVIFKSVKAAATNTPDACAPVRLLPECAELPPLPTGAYSSHAYAVEDRCYSDVRSIRWSEFGP